MDQDETTPNQFDAVPEVITSDHEPVYCLLSVKRETTTLLYTIIVRHGVL